MVSTRNSSMITLFELAAVLQSNEPYLFEIRKLNSSYVIYSDIQPNTANCKSYDNILIMTCIFLITPIKDSLFLSSIHGSRLFSALSHWSKNSRLSVFS